jgi:Flp pilus assembly protein TadG
MRSLKLFRRSALTIRCDRRGIAALEFALIAPVLLLLLLGAYDIGSAVQQRLVLQGALRAGARYAISFPDRNDGIVAAMQQAYPSTWTGVNPTATITPGATPPIYVTLSASPTYSSVLVPISNAPVKYVVRVQ